MYLLPGVLVFEGVGGSASPDGGKVVGHDPLLSPVTRRLRVLQVGRRVKTCRARPRDGDQIESASASGEARVRQRDRDADSS